MVDRKVLIVIRILRRVLYEKRVYCNVSVVSATIIKQTNLKTKRNNYVKTKYKNRDQNGNEMSVLHK